MQTLHSLACCWCVVNVLFTCCSHLIGVLSTSSSRVPGVLYLQTDGQVDPAAKRCADGARVEAQVLEEFGEGVCERHPGSLLCHHHAGPDPGQVQTSGLDRRRAEHKQKLFKKREWIGYFCLCCHSNQTKPCGGKKVSQENHLLFSEESVL